MQSSKRTYATRAIAWVLAFVMVFTMLPYGAFAQGEPKPETRPTDTTTAACLSQKDLQEQFEEAANSKFGSISKKDGIYEGSFNADKKVVTVKILDKTKLFTELRGTGLIDGLTTLYKENYLVKVKVGSQDERDLVDIYTASGSDTAFMQSIAQIVGSDIGNEVNGQGSNIKTLEDFIGKTVELKLTVEQKDCGTEPVELTYVIKGVDGNDKTAPVITAIEDKTVTEKKPIEEITVETDDENAEVTVDGLPDGVTYDKETGKITGTPTVSDWDDTDKDNPEETRDFTITVKAEDEAGNKAEDATFTITVQRDTDGDGTPDVTDTDDDGDGVTDEDEKEAGTDPKDPESKPEQPSDDKTKVTGEAKPVNPTDDPQDTGIKVENKDDDTKISAKDEDGKDVPVEIDKDGNVIVTPGKNVDGPITVTVEDPELPNGKKDIKVPVKGHKAGRDDNGSDSGYWIIPSTPSKTDDKPKHETAIHKLYIYGYEDSTFRPEGNMTRAEAAAMLARLQGLDLSNSARPNFIDVRSGWYNAVINAVVEAGYMKGYPDGTFRPDGKITRAEFAQMIKAIDKANKGAAPFADVKGHWAENAINQAYANGRIAGYPDATFRPNNHITRAEAVTVLNKVYDRSVNFTGLSDVAGAIAPFKDVAGNHWAYYEIIESSNTHEFYRTEAGKVDETWVRLVQSWKQALANR